MKIILFFCLLNFLQPIPIETTFNESQKVLVSKMIVGYERSNGRLLGSLYTYPVYIDPDGNTFTLKVLPTGKIKLIPVEMFYGVVSR